MILIAEAGNCHFGDVHTAKQMIRVARDCGADMVKFQAIDPTLVAKYGSMPTSFYEHVALTRAQYVELVRHGQELRIPVFFSVFGQSVQDLIAYTYYHKISAKQAGHYPFGPLMDKESTFVSVNRDYGDLPNLDKATIMWAAPYLPPYIELDNIFAVADYYEREVGYSDHTLGIDACVRAVQDFGAICIEKHFTLSRDFTWKGQVFRDTVHSALPKELEQLAKAIKGG